MGNYSVKKIFKVLGGVFLALSLLFASLFSANGIDRKTLEDFLTTPFIIDPNLILYKRLNLEKQWEPLKGKQKELLTKWYKDALFSKFLLDKIKDRFEKDEIKFIREILRREMPSAGGLKIDAGKFYIFNSIYTKLEELREEYKKYLKTLPKGKIEEKRHSWAKKTRRARVRERAEYKELKLFKDRLKTFLKYVPEDLKLKDIDGIILKKVSKDKNFFKFLKEKFSVSSKDIMKEVNLLIKRKGKKIDPSHYSHYFLEPLNELRDLYGEWLINKLEEKGVPFYEEIEKRYEKAIRKFKEKQPKFVEALVKMEEAKWIRSHFFKQMRIPSDKKKKIKEMRKEYNKVQETYNNAFKNFVKIESSFNAAKRILLSIIREMQTLTEDKKVKEKEIYPTFEEFLKGPKKPEEEEEEWEEEEEEEEWEATTTLIFREGEPGEEEAPELEKFLEGLTEQTEEEEPEEEELTGSGASFLKRSGR